MFLFTVKRDDGSLIEIRADNENTLTEALRLTSELISDDGYTPEQKFHRLRGIHRRWRERTLLAA